jgi:hypothetical protein
VCPTAQRSEGPLAGARCGPLIHSLRGRGVGQVGGHACSVVQDVRTSTARST